jgi:hypothetical protein
MKFKLIMYLRPVRNFGIIVPHQLDQSHLPNLLRIASFFMLWYLASLLVPLGYDVW